MGIIHHYYCDNITIIKFFQNFANEWGVRLGQGKFATALNGNLSQKGSSQCCGLVANKWQMSFHICISHQCTVMGELSSVSKTRTRPQYPPWKIETRSSRTLQKVWNWKTVPVKTSSSFSWQKCIWQWLEEIDRCWCGWRWWCSFGWWCIRRGGVEGGQM